jgi:hypothetical protein
VDGSVGCAAAGGRIPQITAAEWSNKQPQRMERLVLRWHTSGTAYILKMLYFQCNDQMFYAGQEGLESRHETRLPRSSYSA